MKKTISILLIICISILCLVSCGQAGNEGAPENLTLSGKWIWKSNPNNPMYMYLNFNGQTVRYGTNMFGSDVESATWNCSYKIEGTKLTLTTDDGTDFIFSIQDTNGTIRIFNDDGNEFVREN